MYEKSNHKKHILSHFPHYSKETSASDDDCSIHEDIHSMVKVEMHEPETTPPPSSSAPPSSTGPSPLPSTSGLMPNLGRIPNMPPLHLPGGIPAGQFRPNVPDQPALNHPSAEMLSKQNMFCFGDVTVSEHPDAPPVPMVIPMAYLYPIPSSNKGE